MTNTPNTKQPVHSASPLPGNRGIAGDIAAFLLPLFWFIEVKIVGRLFLIEVVFFCITFFILASSVRRKKLSPFIRNVLIFATIWLSAQVVTDLYRATPFQDYARGWAKIFFFGSNIVAIATLIKDKERRIVLFAAGYAIGELLGLIWFPNVYFEGGRIWKFGFAFPITTLLILTSLRFRSKLVSVLVLIGLSIVNILLDYRSMAGACVAAAILSSYAGLAPGSQVVTRAGRNSAALFLKRLSWTAVAVIVVIAFVRLYGTAEMIELGAALGEGSRYGIDRHPLYGRIEFYVGLLAAMDSPIIGHGSWARNIEYAVLAQAMAIDVGKTVGPVIDDLIPTHSYVVGAWVEAGIVGAFFWCFVLIQTMKALKRSLNIIPNLIPVVSFLLVSFAWAILFSPFGAQGRITAAFNIVMVSIILAKPGSVKK